MGGERDGEDLTEYPDGISEGHGHFPRWIWPILLLVVAAAWTLGPFTLIPPG